MGYISVQVYTGRETTEKEDEHEHSAITFRLADTAAAANDNAVDHLYAASRRSHGSMYRPVANQCSFDFAHLLRVWIFSIADANGQAQVRDRPRDDNQETSVFGDRWQNQDICSRQATGAGCHRQGSGESSVTRCISYQLSCAREHGFGI